MGEDTRPGDLARNGSARQTLGDLRSWVLFLIGLVGFAGSAAVVWASVESKHATAMTRIDGLERAIQDLKGLPSTMAAVQARQQANGESLQRIERALERLASPR